MKRIQVERAGQVAAEGAADLQVVVLAEEVSAVVVYLDHQTVAAVEVDASTAKLMAATAAKMQRG